MKKEKIKKLIDRFWEKFGPFYNKIIGDNIFAIAGQSAFFLILSVVPLAMFAVSVLQGLHISVDVIESYVDSVLNEEAARYLADYLSNMYESTVGISVVTIICTLWSAAQGTHAITNGLNRVHHTYENRNWFLLRLRAMLYTAVMFLIILATIAVVMFGSSVKQMVMPHLPYLGGFVSSLFHLRYVLVFLYMVVLFALAYRNLPNLSRKKRKQYGFLSQLPGAVFSAAAWILLALVIGVYVDDFNGYSIYGGLTRLAVVMIWLYFCMVSTMLGAEFNYVYHRQIVRALVKIRRKRKKR